MTNTEYIDTYKQLKLVKPLTVRGFARNAALDMYALRNAVMGIEQQLNKPRIQFIYLHHIFKDEEAKLEVLIERLKINHSFLSYSEAVDKVMKREIDKPYIVISSDDGFQNSFRL